MNTSLLPFFRPRGILILGASTSPEKLGYGIARNIVESGYQGAIHFVSQKPGVLFSRPLYTEIAQVPDPVDLAVLVVSSSAVPEAIESCGRRGIHAAIIVSAGFREAGPEGALLEQRCLELARKYQVRLLGPNCIGTIDTHLPLDTTFLHPPGPAAGGIAFISQSGAFCAAIIDWSRREGFGFSQLISLGNQVDVNETDMLAEVAEGERTRVIVLYLEAVSDGPRFVKAASEAARRKPVLALKVGRFESGQKAAASHTGALAGSDIAFDAAFSKAGVFRAQTAEQLFDWARALEQCPLPHGRKVAVLTDAGGPGVIAADALEFNGLHLAGLDATTCQALADLLPPAAGVQNPVDMLASASPQNYSDCLDVLLADPNVDSVMIILPPPPMYTTESVANALIPVIQGSTKPVVIALLGSELTANAWECFQQARIVTYPFPERAASALGILSRRAEYVGDNPVSAQRPGRMIPVPRGASAADFLSAYGIRVAPLELATTLDEVMARARDLAYPIVMKIASSDIVHKSDIGGVVTDLRTEKDLVDGYTQMLERVKAAKPEARIEGVHLQQQVEGGQEVIVGAVRDPNFGPLVMFGSGGVEAEGLKDVAFALGPLSLIEAEDLVMRTWAGRKLDGFRSIPAVDKAAVLDILVKISWLAADHAEIGEIEINPLRVLSQGAHALDVRIKLL